MEQTDVKNKKITRRQIIMVVAFLAVIIILAVVLWPKPVQQRQHVYFIVQDARVDFYWDSRTVVTNISEKTITYQYDGAPHFPEVYVYEERNNEMISSGTGYLNIQITRSTDDDNNQSNQIYDKPIERGEYSVQLWYMYSGLIDDEIKVSYDDQAHFRIKIV